MSLREQVRKPTVRHALCRDLHPRCQRWQGHDGICTPYRMRHRRVARAGPWKRPR